MGNLYSNLIATFIAKAEFDNKGSESGSESESGSISEQTVFAPRLSFPEVGKTNVLYIATDECKAYLFSEQTAEYECINSDNTDIGVIQSIL